MRNTNFLDESKNVLTKTFLLVKMAKLYEHSDKISAQGLIS